MTQAQSQHREIDLAKVFEALDRPLGLVDSPERRGDIQRYLESARVHLERAVFDLLSEAVSAVNEAGGGLKARLEYRGGVLDLVVEAVGEEGSPEPERAFSIEGDMEKVTIRIPAELRDLINQAANVRGVSMNAWYVRELARSISRQVRGQVREEMRGTRREQRGRGGGGRSLHGFVGED